LQKNISSQTQNKFTELESNIDKPAKYDDRVSKLDIAEQMTFWATFHQGDENPVELPCLVDTGAGAPYLLVPRHCTIPFRCEPCKATSVLAEGSAVTIDEQATVSIKIGPRIEQVTLRILPSKDFVMSIVFGRQLIEAFQLTIKSVEQVLMDVDTGVLILYDRSRDKVSFIGEEIQTLNRPRPLPNSDENVDWSDKIPDQTKSKVEEILDRICQETSTKLPYCPSASLSLKRVSEDHHKDSISQSFYFEVDIMRPCSPHHAPSPRLYATKCFERLPEIRREEYKKLIQQYVDAGWWIPIESTVGYELPANVFGIFQGEKIRLVADFRELNLHWSASSELAPLYGGIIALGITDYDETVVGDCSSAFLRVRLRQPLWIHTGRGHFITTRMNFGLNFGPEGLRCSAGKIFSQINKELLTGSFAAGMFVDDWYISSDDALQKAAIIIYALGQAGFPCSTKKLQVAMKNEQVKLYNYSISSGRIECNRQERMRKAHAALEKRPTKSSMFELAGLMSYDPVGLHPECKVACDLLRSVIGKLKQDWDDAVDISKPVVAEILQWLKGLMKQKCGHELPVIKDQINLQLQVDASKFGAGWTLSCQEKVLRESAAIWKSKEVYFSSNRLEAMILLRAVRESVKFIQTLKDAFHGREINFELKVQSDNSTAVSWANRTSEPRLDRSPEARVLYRLIAGIEEELACFPSLGCVATVSHIPGKANSRADYLSRLLDRQIMGDTIGELLHGTQDILVKVQEKSKSISELICATSYNWQQAIGRFAELRDCFTAWNNKELDRDMDHEVELIKALQSTCDISQTLSKNSSGLAVYNLPRADGSTHALIFISSINAQRLIMKEMHVRIAHRGRTHTMSEASNHFFMPGGNSVTKQIIQNCLTCAKKNALLNKQAAIPAAVVRRESHYRVFSRISVDHLYVRPTCLSVVCIDTGMFALIPVKDFKTRSVVQALQKLAAMFSCTFVNIHTDAYSAFTSHELPKELKQLGHHQVTITTTDKGASETNPVERPHREVWSILRSKHLKRVNGLISEGDLLGIVSIINSRPIGIDDDGLIITPATLALGPAQSDRGIATRLCEVRDRFYQQHFDQLRRRYSTKGIRLGTLVVGTNVLIYSPSGFKGDQRFKTARIVRIDGPKVTVRLISKNTIQTCSKSQIIPLAKNFQLLDTRESPPGGACGELENESEQGGDVQRAEQHTE